MTETGDPKDNAQAERINNTMKNELLKDKALQEYQKRYGRLSSRRGLLQQRRPHMSIGMMTPAEAALCERRTDKMDQL